MPAMIEDVLQRFVRLQFERQVAEQEAALENFALAGAMFYFERCDVGLKVQFVGLERIWWVD